MESAAAGVCACVFVCGLLQNLFPRKASVWAPDLAAVFHWQQQRDAAFRSGSPSEMGFVCCRLVAFPCLAPYRVVPPLDCTPTLKTKTKSEQIKYQFPPPLVHHYC